MSLNIQIPLKTVFAHTVVSVAIKYSWEQPAALNFQEHQQQGALVPALGHLWLSRGGAEPGTRNPSPCMLGLGWVTAAMSTRADLHPVFHRVSSVFSLLYKSNVIIFWSVGHIHFQLSPVFLSHHSGLALEILMTLAQVIVVEQLCLLGLSRINFGRLLLMRVIRISCWFCCKIWMHNQRKTAVTEDRGLFAGSTPLLCLAVAMYSQIPALWWVLGVCWGFSFPCAF